MPELGKIQKPNKDRYANKKRLIFVPIFIIPTSIYENDCENLFKKYWDEVADAINKLETSLGSINTIFHEMNSKSGEEGIKIIEDLNPTGSDFIKIFHNSGTLISEFENDELIAETMDWQRISSIGLLSKNAKEITMKEYTNSIQNRNKSLIDKIENELNNGENGILFMRDDHGLQFSNEVEVFYVSTTVINELQNWLGQQLNQFMNPQTGEATQQ